MSWPKIRQRLIQLIPIKELRSFLSYKYGWFPNNYVKWGACISSIKNLKLGGNVYIASNAEIHCEGGVSIGYNSRLGTGAFILSTNHNYKCETEVPYDKTILMQSVDIGRNCWLGARCMICPGVKIEEGAIVAMGSVVTKSVPKCAIVGGNPAKIIGWRDKDQYDKLTSKEVDYTIKNELPRQYVKVEGFKKYLEG